MTQATLTIRCPYCGNRNTVIIGRRYLSLEGIYNVGFGFAPASSVFTGYRIKCQFCGRDYIYYDIRFNDIKPFLTIDKGVIEWLNKYGVLLKDLPSMTVGIVEPQDHWYKRVARWFTQKMPGKPKEKFIEIVFNLVRGENTWVGVLVGRMIFERQGNMHHPTRAINIEDAYWFSNPPQEV